MASLGATLPTSLPLAASSMTPIALPTTAMPCWRSSPRRCPARRWAGLAALLAHVRKPSFRVWAEQSPFDLKDVLKRRGYRWTDRRIPCTSMLARRSTRQRSRFCEQKYISAKWTSARYPSPLWSGFSSRLTSFDSQTVRFSLAHRDVFRRHRAACRRRWTC